MLQCVYMETRRFLTPPLKPFQLFGIGVVARSIVSRNGSSAAAFTGLYWVFAPFLICQREGDELIRSRRG
jgi:hypothetical protein